MTAAQENKKRGGHFEQAKICKSIPGRIDLYVLKNKHCISALKNATHTLAWGFNTNSFSEGLLGWTCHSITGKASMHKSV